MAFFMADIKTICIKMTTDGQYQCSYFFVLSFKIKSQSSYPTIILNFTTFHIFSFISSIRQYCKFYTVLYCYLKQLRVTRKTPPPPPPNLSIVYRIVNSLGVSQSPFLIFNFFIFIYVFWPKSKTVFGVRQIRLIRLNMNSISTTILFTIKCCKFILIK